jgi:hypothetical protein
VSCKNGRHINVSPRLGLIFIFPIKNPELGWVPVLTPVIPATQEAEIRRITVQSQPRQIVLETLSQKTLHKNGLVEWLKVKDLSSNPSATKKRAQIFHGHTASQRDFNSAQ